MKTTQDVCKYAKAKGISDMEVAVDEGMKEMSKEFRDMGGEIYRDA